MNTKQTDPVVFYDGQCLLCSRAIRSLVNADKRMVLKFSPQQGESFNTLISKDLSIYQESIVFIKNGRVYTRSTAVLAIVKELGLPWKLLYAFIIIPKFFRDAVYMVIAKNRKKWFGESASCYMGSKEHANRFLP